jgi:ABC-type bacteriocin/lantibiotic exporter with double-glycine peptidase domain
VLGDPSIIQSNEYLSYLYSKLSFQSNNSFLIFLGSSAIVLLLISAFSKTLTYYALFRFSNMRRHIIGKKLLLRYIHQPYQFFLTKNSSFISKTILSETDLAIGQVIIPSLQLVTYLIITLFLVSFLVIVDPILALALTCIFGIFYIFMYMTVRKYLDFISKEREKANSKRFKLVSEIIGGIKDLKLLGREEVYIKEYETPSYSFSSYTASSQTLSSVPQFLVEVIAFGAILIMAMYSLSNNDSDLGKLLPVLGLYALGALKLKPAINQIYASITTMKFGVSALDTIINEFKESHDLEYSKLHTKPKLKINNELKLENITFSYEKNKIVLNNINLTIKANTTIGIIGTTGAGKTTLLDIILGLLEPIAGNILIDNTSLKKDDIRKWQNSIGYVPQSIFLSDDTIASNVAFGINKELIDYSRLEKALEMAQANEFVSCLKQGYNTDIGERGIRLSGGQRQRIGIARALYHEPSLIVLDEATSALDNETEKEVMKSIESMSGTKTIIMIAHRLSTVANCDMVVTMEKGKIVNIKNKEKSL